MKKLLLLLLICSPFAFGQISTTYLNHWQLTPTDDDSAGVFCRIFHQTSNNRFYAVYAGRQAAAPSGPMDHFTWREYDHNFNYTGTHGTLSGHSSAGDFAMLEVGGYYYHVTTAPASWSYRLSKYDINFQLVNYIDFPLDSSDSQADMLFNYTNGRLIIGAYHVDGSFHPSMPTQQASWNPTMHKWEYDLNLNAIGSPVYLQETFTTWGASCIYNNNTYNIITMRKWPNYELNVYRYDASWNYLDSVHINNDGQWSQGVVWDGQHYLVTYHSGHEHRSGNITLAVFDANWTQLYDTLLTNNAVFTPNISPPLQTTQYNANRPFLLKIQDTLYVSYDVDNYELQSYSPVHFYLEGNQWQAHVAKVLLHNAVLSTSKEENPTSIIVAPNPFTTETRLDFGKHLIDGSISLLDIQGNTILEIGGIEGNTYTFDRGKLASGIYFLQVKNTIEHFPSVRLMIND